jgi:hypothetical protein
MDCEKELLHQEKRQIQKAPEMFLRGDKNIINK